MKEEYSVQQSANNTHIWDYLWIACIALWIAYTSPILYIPDSFEHVILGQCIFEGYSTALDCDNVFIPFRQPLLTWLTGFLHHFVVDIDPFVTLGVIAYFASVATIALLHNIVKPYIGWFSVLLIGGILFSDYIDALGIFADSKGLVLVWLLLTVDILLQEDKNWKMGFFAGVSMGLAFLCRIEMLIPMTAFAIYVLLWDRKILLWYILGSGSIFAGWLWWLWGYTHLTVLSPRFWETYIIIAMQDMPLRWVQELFGMGSWNTPMRNIAMQFPILDTTGIDISITETDTTIAGSAWLWLQQSIYPHFALQHWLVFVCGITHSVYRKKNRRLGWLLLAMISASIIIGILPQARYNIFASSYTIPFWMAMWVWVFVQLYEITKDILHRKFPESSKNNAILAIVMALFSLDLALDSNIDIPKNNIEVESSSQALRYWLEQNTTPESTILSSFEISPIVFLANRRWQEWPSPFEMQQRIDSIDHELYALVWIHDAHAWNSLAFANTTYTPIAYMYEKDNGFVVFQLK